MKLTGDGNISRISENAQFDGLALQGPGSFEEFISSIQFLVHVLFMGMRRQARERAVRFCSRTISIHRMIEEALGQF
jgi:hypothetical protein